MKFLIVTIIIFFTALFCSNICVKAQTDTVASVIEQPAQDQEEPDPLRFFKAKYDTTFDAPYELVAEAVENSITEDLNCVVVSNSKKTNEEGFLRIVIKSDYCVFVEGDSTFDKLKFYSYEMPFVRGGSWKNGRMQYNFIITEQPDDKAYLLLKGNLSGYEYYVTNRVHFWTSNGIFEHEMFERLAKKISAQMKK